MCRPCSPPTPVYPLLKRRQAVLSLQSLSLHPPPPPPPPAPAPPGSPFEENKFKLLISVRFIRWTRATGGFGKVEANWRARGCGWVGGGGVGPPPPSFRANYEHNSQDPRCPYIKLPVPPIVRFGCLFACAAHPVERQRTTTRKQKNRTVRSRHQNLWCKS